MKGVVNGYIVVSCFSSPIKLPFKFQLSLIHLGKVLGQPPGPVLLAHLYFFIFLSCHLTPGAKIPSHADHVKSLLSAANHLCHGVGLHTTQKWQVYFPLIFLFPAGSTVDGI